MAEEVERTPILLTDPSEFRPEVKDVSKFRDYRIHNTPDHVVKTYDLMHTNQTLQYVKDQIERWGNFNQCRMTILEALEKLNDLVDESDPDIDLPNSLHAYQTAEGIRLKHPDKPWFQVTGLLHDLGKVLALWGLPQWSVVGDTFPVGCAPAPSIVFGVESFAKNIDMADPKLNSKLGIYEENCGLDKVYMSWGHDEYMYRVLCANTHYLPEEALYMVRFHSFYPWHSHNAYTYLTDNKDQQMMPWIKEFNQFDLYTKSPDIPDVDSLYHYYEELLRKWVPGKLRF